MFGPLETELFPIQAGQNDHLKIKCFPAMFA